MDIGNSAVKVSAVSNGVVASTRRIALSSERQGSRIDWQSALPDPDEFDAVGFTSVVPSLSSTLQAFANEVALQVFAIGADSRLPFRIAYETPQTLGADRVAAAAGAWFRYSRSARNLIVVDAGTAVNFEVITHDAVYQGGAICPGLDAMADALVGKTAQLPPVELSLPQTVVARTTNTAVQSGVVFGYVDAVTGIVRRIVDALAVEPASDVEPFVLVTGGNAVLLVEGGLQANRHDPDLVALGIAELTRLQMAGGAESF